MIRAVLKDGKLHPVGPIPEDWREGQEFEITAYPTEGGTEGLDEWAAEMERLAAQIDPADARELQRILAENDAEERAARNRESGVL